MPSIRLTHEEATFLQRVMGVSLHCEADAVVVIELSEEEMCAIRDQLLEYLDIHGFDGNYELTDSGRMAETLADKLYV